MKFVNKIRFVIGAYIETAILVLTEFKARRRANLEELHRGTVLDPYNHPSYTPEVRQEHMIFAARRAELQAEIDALA